MELTILAKGVNLGITKKKRPQFFKILQNIYSFVWQQALEISEYQDLDCQLYQCSHNDILCTT